MARFQYHSPWQPVLVLGVAVLTGCAASKTPPPPAAVSPPPPAPQPIVATGTYSAVFSGVVQPDGAVEHLLAVRDESPDQLTSNLDLVSVSGSFAPISLTSNQPTADPLSILVSPASPEAVMYRDNVSPETDLGTGFYADLSGPQPVAKPLPGASDVPPGGLFFGADGEQVLFCAQFDVSTGTCNLYWSAGRSNPSAVARGCAYWTIFFSRDRTRAVAGINVDLASGIGDLVLIDMTTGAVSRIASKVVLQGSAYNTSDNQLTYSSGSAITMTPDASVIAYGTEDGQVWRWSQQQGATSVAPQGRFPSLSVDGRSIAFYTSDGIVVQSGGRTVATAPAAGVVSPLFSPDGRFVAYLSSILARGSNSEYGSALGDVTIIDLEGAAVPLHWGSNVAWYSVTFGPLSGKTNLVTMLANCRDLTGTATLDGAIADFLAGDPAAAPAKPLAGSIRPFLRPLLLSGGWAFMAQDPPFVGTSYIASIWLPGDPWPRRLSDSAVNGTVKTGVQTPSLTPVPSPHSDEILFLGSNAIPSFQIRGFTLYGAHTNGAVFELDENVIYATIANDGRVLVVEGIEGDRTQARLRVLPFALPGHP